MAHLTANQRLTSRVDNSVLPYQIMIPDRSDRVHFSHMRSSSLFRLLVHERELKCHRAPLKTHTHLLVKLFRRRLSTEVVNTEYKDRCKFELDRVNIQRCALEFKLLAWRVM